MGEPLNLEPPKHTILDVGQCAPEQVMCYNRGEALKIKDFTALCVKRTERLEKCTATLEKATRPASFLGSRWFFLSLGLAFGTGAVATAWALK